MGQTEVTVAAYRKYAAGHGKKPPEGDGELPVVGVSRNEAKEYCAAVGGRLPTEAEWEYAARGGSKEAWYGPLAQIAWYSGNSNGVPHPVGKKRPNAFGLYDMLGNASEWVLDRYYNKFDVEAPATGKVEEPILPNHFTTLRGGFWESEPANVRLSRRLARMDEAVEFAGLRCVADELVKW